MSAGARIAPAPPGSPRTPRSRHARRPRAAPRAARGRPCCREACRSTRRSARRPRGTRRAVLHCLRRAGARSCCPGWADLRAEGGRVQRDVALALGAREVLEQLRLEPLVAVEHEDGQKAADVRPEYARSPEVVALRVRLLADHDDVMTGAAPFAGQRARV